MKKFIILSAAAVLAFTACVDLDLNPLTQGSSENWFNTTDEVEMSLNYLYGETCWRTECIRPLNTEYWTDDWHERDKSEEFLGGTVTSTWDRSEAAYKYYYKAIQRTNTILESLDNGNLKKNATEDQINRYRGEASFFRALAYSYLTFLWGDVPFYTSYITLDEAYNMTNTPREVVLQQIYDDYDVAIEYLPNSYTGVFRVTQACAYAFKARAAQWFGDWEICAENAQKCIDTGKYSLVDGEDWLDMFLPETKSCPEWVFYIPRSQSLGYTSTSVQKPLPRIMGGYSQQQPSIDTFCSFLCTDGKTIDKSEVYDPLYPWENRDPRLTKTFVEWGTELLGYVIDPRPWVQQVTNPDGALISNKENRTIDQYGAYNGLYIRKGISEDWLDLYSEANVVFMRYADVLLMLAEAKCELGELSDGVALDAINQVRARAYGVPSSYTSSYPAVTTTDQAEFRTNLRLERRMEFVWEGRRYFDIIRWRVAEKALNKSLVGINIDKMKSYTEKEDLTWYFPTDFIPEVDESGIVDVTPLVGMNCFYQTNVAQFEAPTYYLWPFPADELLICPYLKQNDGY